MSNEVDQLHVTLYDDRSRNNVVRLPSHMTRTVGHLDLGRPSRLATRTTRATQRTRRKVRFSPYPTDDWPCLPWRIGPILDDMTKEDFPPGLESPEQVQDDLLKCNRRYLRSSRTGVQSWASLTRELLNLSPSPTPSTLPYLSTTPDSSERQCMTPHGRSSADMTNEAEILAEIKKSVHPLISSHASEAILQIPHVPTPHTPDLFHRQVADPIINQRGNHASRIASLSVEEDFFYGRPTSRRLLPELTACCASSTPPSRTAQQHAIAFAQNEDRRDIRSIPPLGLAMRKGDYKTLVRRIVGLTSGTAELAAVSIMPHSPKKKVKMLRGLERHQDDEKSRQFRKSLCEEAHMLPHNLIAHARYSNLASPERSVYLAAKESLEREMARVGKLGIKTLVFHLGEDKVNPADVSRGRVAGIVRQLLLAQPEVTLAIETTGCHGPAHGSSSLNALYDLIKLVDMPGRLKVCIDLCHLSQQYDMTTVHGRLDFLFDVESVGFHNVAAIHVSDNYYEQGQRRSRHASLTDGVIPIEAFRHILGDDRLRHVPVILECRAYYPAYEARGLRSSEEEFDSRSKITKINNLEQCRRLSELRFLGKVLECPDEDWHKRRDSIISTWQVERRKLERQIYLVVQEMSLESLRKFAEQRDRIKRSMRHAQYIQNLHPDVYGYPRPVKIEQRETWRSREIQKDCDSNSQSRTAARRRRVLGLDIEIRSV